MNPFKLFRDWRAARAKARYDRDYARGFARGFAWAEHELMSKQMSPLVIRFSLQWMPPIAFDHGALDAVVMFESLLKSANAQTTESKKAIQSALNGPTSPDHL